MIPGVGRVLNGVYRALLRETLPQVRDPYAIQTTSIAAALSHYAAQEFDRAASRRIEENDAMRDISCEMVFEACDFVLDRRTGDFRSERHHAA